MRRGAHPGSCASAADAQPSMLTSDSGEADRKMLKVLLILRSTRRHVTIAPERRDNQALSVSVRHRPYQAGCRAARTARAVRTDQSFAESPSHELCTQSVSTRRDTQGAYADKSIAISRDRHFGMKPTERWH